MGRLEWSRFGGDDIESVVSMFVCREEPHAFRIRPSQGDGGIDVCVPLDSDHYEIYQVKKFTQNLGSSEKRQIKKSHKRIQTYATKRGWTIDRWHLTLPLDPTPENTKWLEELEKTGPFPCDWIGLPHLEGWVARYPDIVDYYFRDGRERMQHEIAQFVQLSGIQMAGPLSTSPEDFTALQPAMVQGQLAALRDTLNRRDPHFQYDIAVGHTFAEAAATGSYPARVASTSRQIGDSTVTFHVLARCAESVVERPITFHATLIAKTGSDEHRDIEYFFKYGRPPSRPLDVQNFSADMPGGLGGDFEAAKMTLGASTPGETFDRRMSILSPTDDLLATVDLRMHHTTTNSDSTGIASRGTDSVGFLEIEPLGSIRDGKVEMTLLVHRGDPTGHYPDQIEPSLSFVHHFTAPNRFRIERTRGSGGSVEQDIPAVPRNRDTVSWNNVLLRYVRALITIQRYTPIELKVPDLAVEGVDHVEDVLRTARLLNGEEVDRGWDHVAFTLNPDAPELDDPMQVVFAQNLHVTVGTAHVDLGSVLVTIDAAQVANKHVTADGSCTADLVPALGKRIAHFRWMGEASLDHELDAEDPE